MTLRNSMFLAAGLAVLALTATGRSSAQAVSKLGAKQAATQQAPYQGTVVEDIIARVNDQVISRSDYDRAEQELESQAKQRNWSDAELEDQRKQLLRDLIDNQLLLSRGKELGITGDAETVRQLDDLRKQNHLDSMEALQKAAEEQGVSFEDFKASIRNRVITSQVIREEVGRRINITQADEQQYYDAHKAEFDRPEEVRLSEILVPTANPDDAAEVATAQAKAEDLEKQLKDGKDFAAVAKVSSGGPTAAQGGSIGDFKRGQLAKVLEDDTFSLQPGQFTAPVRTKQGFVILKVDAHQQGGLAPFKQVEPQIEDAVGMEKMNPALRQYLGHLREEAYIDIKPGFVDAGAVPGETKPVFSAYQPPQPKKKKHLERTRFGGRGRTVTHKTTQQASAAGPAVPAGVPSLADVPQGGSADSATATAASKPIQVASAGTQTPGKKEKVRFGQAPRETLPKGDAKSQDAGATAANGNGSSAEEQTVADVGAGAAPAGARYSNGESAGIVQAVPEEKKTRFADRPRVKKAKKNKNGAADPLAPEAATPDEVATRQTQDSPLGLNGDTSKKPAKVKPTGGKTRYADEGKKGSADQQQPALTTPPGTAPGAQNSPSSVNPNGQTPMGTPQPAPTQDTTNGTGDPLGPTVPTPAKTPLQPQ